MGKMIVNHLFAVIAGKGMVMHRLSVAQERGVVLNSTFLVVTSCYKLLP